jgi:hypothetical protein
MQRRKFITAAGTLGVAAVAGCLNSGSGGTGSEDDSVDVDVEFQATDGDLVAHHAGGDPLQNGNRVYITVAGDQVAETQLSEDVHVGGEIIQAQNVTDEYTGVELVGLYRQQGGGDIELASTEVAFGGESLVQTTPNAQIHFDYDASSDTLDVYHDGGDSIKPDNTEQLNWAGDNAGSMLFASDQSNIDSTGTVTGKIQGGDLIGTGSPGSDGMIELVWVAPNDNGSSTLGTWEGPEA